MPRPIVPVADPTIKAFWDACNEKRLTVQYCTACDRRQFPPEAGCRNCRFPFHLTMQDTSGRGTIIGYSINDTVVIFDRLRENLRKFKSMPLMEVMNLSVNETLSRTIMTSGTTLLALIALLVLGGDVIRGFVFAISWGIVVGTYSSVYVAKNIVLWLGVKRDWTKPSNTEGNQFANIDA